MGSVLQIATSVLIDLLVDEIVFINEKGTRMTRI